MKNERPDSEQVLRKLKYEEEQKQKNTRGRLKILLGYAAGPEKPTPCWRQPMRSLRHGVDVVAGYIEPHARPDTQAMAEGLETLPPLLVDYKGICLQEFDLDAALKRRPKLPFSGRAGTHQRKGLPQSRNLPRTSGNCCGQESMYILL